MSALADYEGNLVAPLVGTLAVLLITVLVSCRLRRSGWPSPRVLKSASAAAPKHDSPTSGVTGIPSKIDETGSMDAPGAEVVSSAFALVQRVRALGLHLGDVLVTGMSIGLPNASTGRAVFSEENTDALMRGDSMIGALPQDVLQQQLDKKIVQIVKDAHGNRQRAPLTMLQEVIKLASRIGDFDLNHEFGVDPKVVETMDTTYALAVAAGLQALENAGLIPAQSVGANGVAASRKLRHEHRDSTGVIFAASFPALDSMVDETARFMATRLEHEKSQTKKEFLQGVEDFVRRVQAQARPVDLDAPSELEQWLELQTSAASEAPNCCDYEYNRKLIFKLLVMANSQLAEIVQARGPNLHINAACAGTTAAIVLANDWLRVGRCRRVVVISADNITSQHLMPWVGIGFLALGAASVKSDVADAALPFDRRRNGLVLGAGAVGLVLEADTAAAGRECKPLAKVLAARHANSAYHASAIGIKHTSEQLELLLQEVELVHKLRRQELAESMLYMSHETFTHARGGGCAGAEVTALRSAFGQDVRKILITNSKGLTGHAMGVCFEDPVAIASLAAGRAPPIVNHCEADPVLGNLRLHHGGDHDAQYALHFAAGFGSQVAYVLYGKVTPEWPAEQASGTSSQAAQDRAA